MFDGEGVLVYTDTGNTYEGNFEKHYKHGQAKLTTKP